MGKERAAKPCAGLAYDVESGVLEDGLFRLREHRDRGRTLKVVLEWTPAEGDKYQTLSVFRRDFYGMIGTLSGSNTSIHEIHARDAISLYVITASDSHTDILEFIVEGPAIEGMLEGVRKIKEQLHGGSNLRPRDA